MRNDRRIAAQICALSLFAAAALAQAPAATKSNENRDHPSQYWVVLLDGSLSSRDRDRAQSEALGQKDYQLRNEVLSLLQNLLAAQRDKEQGFENEYLEVYLFGRRPGPIERLSAEPTKWSGVHPESWWSQNAPRDFGDDRTDYFAALHQAVADLKTKHRDSKQHILLISDGELDVGSINRPTRGPIETEELDVYRDLLRTDNQDMRWLADHKVNLYALALDELLHTFNDDARQKEIGRRLYDARLGGAQPVERALSVVEDFRAKKGPAGLLLESEGPYVMRALADQLGGKARSVRYDNVLDVLWDTLFPEHGRRRMILPPGTDKVIVFTPVATPLQVKLRKEGEEGGGTEEVTLRYDAKKQIHRFEPPEDATKVQEVNVHATSQYATWVITSPNLAEVDLTQDEEALRQQFSVLPVTNVRFEWTKDKPPERLLAGKPVELVLDLNWKAKPWTGPTREEWRQRLSGVPLRATAQVEFPSADPETVTLQADVAKDTSDAVLHLHGAFAHTQTPGVYEVTVELNVGEEPAIWQLRAPPVRFRTLGESPLSRFALAVRTVQTGGDLGEPEEIKPAGFGLDTPVDLATTPPAKLVFEWSAIDPSQDPAKACESVAQLHVDLPDLERHLGSTRDALGGKPRRENGRLLCYQSTPETFETNDFGHPLLLRADDDLTSWERQLRLTLPEPPGKKWLRRLLWGLLALLLAAALAVALIPPLRQRFVDWIRKLRADFPLAADVAGGGSVAWHPGEAKRLLLLRNDKGEVTAELSKRKPRGSEQAVEVVLHSADEYRVRPLGGAPWMFCKAGPAGQPASARPLSSSGETVTFLELARGTRLELEPKSSGAKVTVHHKSR